MFFWSLLRYRLYWIFFILSFRLSFFYGFLVLICVHLIFSFFFSFMLGRYFSFFLSFSGKVRASRKVFYHNLFFVFSNNIGASLYIFFYQFCGSVLTHILPHLRINELVLFCFLLLSFFKGGRTVSVNTILSQYTSLCTDACY